MEQTARSLGYYLPAAWEPKKAVWWSWIGADRVPADPLPAAEVCAAWIRAAAVSQPVHVVATPQSLPSARQLLDGQSQVVLHETDHACLPIRRLGPHWLSHPQDYPPAMVDWPGGPGAGFRAELAQWTQRRTFPTDILLPPTALDSNGQGVLLASRSLVVASNPGRSWKEIERALAEQLCARAVLWLDSGPTSAEDHKTGPAEDGVRGDEVEHLARFVSRRTVLVAVARDRASPSYRVLKGNASRLEESADANGRPLRVIPIRVPSGDRAGGIGSLGFLILDRLIFVPQLDDPADWDLMQCLAEAFPDHQVRGVPTETLDSLGCSPHQMAHPEPSA